MHRLVRHAPARRAMKFLDARSESAGESYSRVLLDRLGVPAPIPQFEVWHRGMLVGRADFGWQEFRTLVEFDGKQKYGSLLKSGQTAEMRSLPRNGERMRYATWVGRSSAGSGRTCTTLRSCGYGWSGRSSGASEPPDLLPPHFLAPRPPIRGASTVKVGRHRGSGPGRTTSTRNPLDEAKRSQP